ncbi:MAG: hypothetical protein GX175_00340 [Halanaerobiaceae bacterium]|nr:hypothetical protein [Halanaerobiaceae bacterium]
MGEGQVLTYENIRVKDFEFKQIYKIEIRKEVNEHDTLYLYGLLSEEKKDNYIKSTNEKSEINVIYKHTDNEETLFKGLISEINLTVAQQCYYLEIKGISCTSLLDVKRTCRSFQDISMTYEELAKEIIKDYEQADVKYNADKEELEHLLVQYGETDWEFLKRAASKINTVLVSNSTHPDEGIRFHFGIEKGSTREIEEFNYTIRKRIRSFNKMKENYAEDISHRDFEYYDLQSTEIFDVGNKVKFMEQDLYVQSVYIHMEDGILKGEYKLSSINGIFQEKLTNQNLIGLSLAGKVLEVKEDKVKVHLDIDEEQDKSKAVLLPYSTGYTAANNTGIYIMPEVDDIVYLYFPDDNEENAFIKCSIRQELKGGDKVSDPDVKYIRTNFGKEIRLSRHDIIISSLDDEIYIRINDEDGIEIISSENVRISAKKNMDINVGANMAINVGANLAINAGKDLSIKCRNSNIKMGQDIDLKGKKVNIN